MADNVSFDFSEINKLAADLGRQGVDAARNVRKAVEVTARNIKDDAKKSVGDGSSTWQGLPPSIDYDVESNPHDVTAEIGYNKGKAAGKLGNIREFGAPNARRTVSSGGKTIPTAQRLPRPGHSDLEKALEKNQDDFVEGIQKVVGGL